MDTIYFEISGFCNAKCLYCPTGNGSTIDAPKRFIPVDEFIDAVHYLKNIRVMNANTTLHLYNWGDPLMHPKFNDILDFLNNEGIKCAISTNGSIYKDIKDSPFLKKVIFSMSGASQETYNIMHGLNYESVITNIKRYMGHIDNDKIEIRFFVYTFNLHEIESIRDIFPLANVTLPYCMDRHIAGDIMRGDYVPPYIFMDHLQQLPQESNCNLIANNIAIDEFCNVLQCCGISKNDGCYSIGSIYDFKNEGNIQFRRINNKVCIECVSLNIPGYWLHNHMHINDYIM